MSRRTSRIPGFFKKTVDERLEHVQRFSNLSDEDLAVLKGNDEEALASAEHMIENVVGLFHLPVGFATNFRVDDQDVLVPMVIEEPSVVAAASKAARLLRTGEGIVTAATPACAAASNSSACMASSVRMLPVGRPMPTSWKANEAPTSAARAVTVATPWRIASAIAAVTSTG